MPGKFPSEIQVTLLDEDLLATKTIDEMGEHVDDGDAVATYKLVKIGKLKIVTTID